MFKKQALLPIFISILVAVVYILLAMNFKEMYQNFGAEIPSQTQFILDNYWILLVLPLATITGIYLSDSGTNTRRLVVIISLITTVLIWFFVSWSLYLPLYIFGAQ